jgi:hypothetical protein
MRRIFLSLVFLTLATIAQEAPKAVLVDEFGELPCEDILARTDYLASELQRDPTLAASIVISPPRERPSLAQGRRKLISSTLQLRGVSSDRYIFRKMPVSSDGKMATRFWKIPLGAEPPGDNSFIWKEVAPATDRPYIFGFVDDIDICPTFVSRAFAKLLLGNPGARGNIVVIDSKYATATKYKVADLWIKEFTESHGLPRNRLRLFFSMGDEPGVEFWFVPAKKK